MLNMINILSTKVVSLQVTHKEKWCNRYWCHSNEVNLLLPDTKLCNKDCERCRECKFVS